MPTKELSSLPVCQDVIVDADRDARFSGRRCDDRSAFRATEVVFFSHDLASLVFVRLGAHCLSCRDQPDAVTTQVQQTTNSRARKSSPSVTKRRRRRVNRRRLPALRRCRRATTKTPVWSAKQWKAFYAGERKALGAEGIARLLDAAEPLVATSAPTSTAAALVFPHTRLETSGALVAAAALAVVRSGAEEVLALGVLHGARERDAEPVQRARAGDPEAIAALRRVHGAGAPGDEGHAEEEFSLDGFAALIEGAARREGRRAPRLLARYPFLTGAAPESLPGFGELARALERGAALVATADMIHHGAGYGTPEAARLDRRSEAALGFARAAIEDLLALLDMGDFAGHERRCAEVRSDFRDAGPVFAHLAQGRGARRPALFELCLVDYAGVLDAEEPTWVAAAFAGFGGAAQG
jgi:hypothetical protein